MTEVTSEDIAGRKRSPFFGPQSPLAASVMLLLSLVIWLVPGALWVSILVLIGACLGLVALGTPGVIRQIGAGLLVGALATPLGVIFMLVSSSIGT